jgi:hypothetical protein
MGFSNLLLVCVEKKTEIKIKQTEIVSPKNKKLIMNRNFIFFFFLEMKSTS